MNTMMLWWKAIHIIAVISWMAGLLYLFRLFIYHNQETELIVKERLAIMESRLLNVITTPAGLLTLVSGFTMAAYQPEYYFKQGWFHAKLFAVFLLLLLHLGSISLRRRLLKTPHPYSNVGLRILNEIPTLLMIVIVILAVLKPF